jgi:serine protease AprX
MGKNKSLIKTVIIAFTFMYTYQLKSQITFPAKYFIKFADKNASPFSVSNPSAFLSNKAIARRTKNNYPITIEDLPVNQVYINGVINAGASVFARSKWYNGVVVSIPSQTVYNTLAALTYVQNLNRIAFKMSGKKPYEKNQLEAQSISIERTVGLRSMSLDRFQYGASYNQVNMLGGVCMHNKGFDGTGMVIVILDSGFENADMMTAFDSARSDSRIKSTYDFVEMDTSVYTDHNHGANVFSCIGANVPNTLVGTAPKAAFHLCRTEDVFSEYPVEEYNWVAGLEYADSLGADVVNSSLGYTEFTDPVYNHTYLDLNGRTSPASNATSLAARRGLIVCNSAGNEGNSPWHYIGVPADGDSMLAVGSVNSNRIKSGFSSFGPSADGRVKPDVAAQGGGTHLAYTFGNNFGASSGTSFSSPLMAGMVACLIQAHPNKTAMQIINAIKQSGHQYNAPDSLLGFGIPNFCKADSLLNISIGLNETSDLKSLCKVFPNPVDSKLNIVLSNETGKVSIIVRNVLGQMVLQKEVFLLSLNNNIDLNISELNKGNYNLELRSAHLNSNFKLIKY